MQQMVMGETLLAAANEVACKCLLLLCRVQDQSSGSSSSPLLQLGVAGKRKTAPKPACIKALHAAIGSFYLAGYHVHVYHYKFGIPGLDLQFSGQYRAIPSLAPFTEVWTF